MLHVIGPLVTTTMTQFGKTLYTLHLFYNSRTGTYFAIFYLYIQSKYIIYIYIYIIQIGFCVLSFTCASPKSLLTSPWRTKRRAQGYWLLHTWLFLSLALYILHVLPYKHFSKSAIIPFRQIKYFFTPQQWRSQTFIFGGAKRTPKARDPLGGSGGMHPRENFEI